MLRSLKLVIANRFQNKSIKNPDTILQQFKSGLIKILGTKLKGIYIIGSYGLQDFNPDLSDIDFIVSLEEVLSRQDIKTSILIGKSGSSNLRIQDTLIIIKPCYAEAKMPGV